MTYHEAEDRYRTALTAWRTTGTDADFNRMRRALATLWRHTPSHNTRRLHAVQA